MIQRGPSNSAVLKWRRWGNPHTDHKVAVFCTAASKKGNEKNWWQGRRSKHASEVARTLNPNTLIFGVKFRTWRWQKEKKRKKEYSRMQKLVYTGMELPHVTLELHKMAVRAAAGGSTLNGDLSLTFLRTSGVEVFMGDLLGFTVWFSFHLSSSLVPGSSTYRYHMYFWCLLSSLQMVGILLKKHLTPQMPDRIWSICRYIAQPPGQPQDLSPTLLLGNSTSSF